MKDDRHSEYSFKITGTCHIPQPLKLDHVYTIATRCEVRSVAENSTDSDTRKFKYTLKQTGEAVIQNRDGKKLPVDSRSQSKKLRSQIIHLNNTDMDDQEFYELVMCKLRHKMADLLPDIIK